MGAAIPLLYPSTQFWNLPVVTTAAEEAGQNARLHIHGIFFLLRRSSLNIYLFVVVLYCGASKTRNPSLYVEEIHQSL
jgi:hypothetical protein